MLSDEVEFKVKHTEWDKTISYAVAQKVQFMKVRKSNLYAPNSVAAKRIKKKRRKRKEKKKKTFRNTRRT